MGKNLGYGCGGSIPAQREIFQSFEIFFQPPGDPPGVQKKISFRIMDVPFFQRLFHVGVLRVQRFQKKMLAEYAYLRASLLYKA